MSHKLRRCYTRCGRGDMLITMGVLFSFLKRLIFCWRHKAWCFLSYFACVSLLFHLWSMILSDQWGGKGVTEGVRGCSWPLPPAFEKIILCWLFNPSRFRVLCPPSWKKLKSPPPPTANLRKVLYVTTMSCIKGIFIELRASSKITPSGEQKSRDLLTFREKILLISESPKFVGLDPPRT